MNIGLIAHDTKKTLLQNFCIAYRSILTKHELYATGTSGRLVQEETNLNVHKFLSGHVGGEQQLASMIDQGLIDLMFCFYDPLKPRKQETDVHELVRLCDLHCIPVATNMATAEMLIKSLDRGDLDWREICR
mgnify:CR=1